MKNSTPASLQRRQHRKARHAAQRQAQRRARRRAAAAQPSRGQAVLYELFKTIHHFFPDLFDQLRQLEDCRQKSDYTLAEILMAGIALFVFQQGSRNALNNKREEEKFRKHYWRLFKLRLPHLDTVHRVLCRLPEAELEQLKHALVKTLLEKKVLHKYRLFGRWFVVAVDATGVVSFSERHCEHCLHRTSKTGKTTYFHNVLEAKLIAATGFAISLLTEWIVNPAGEYDKQDCERKAFDRLAVQLKQRYPRLPLCLTRRWHLSLGGLLRDLPRLRLGLYPHLPGWQPAHRVGGGPGVANADPGAVPPRAALPRPHGHRTNLSLVERPGLSRSSAAVAGVRGTHHARQRR